MKLREKIRVIALLLCCAALCCAPLAAQATDNNPFFNAHAGECVPGGWQCLLNGEAGYVRVLEAPGGAVESYLVNEQTLTVYGVWTDGEGQDWAQLRYTPLPGGRAEDDLNGEKIGWLPMTELLRIYTRQDFISEHFTEFISAPVTLTITEEDSVLLWPYPGSGGQGRELRWLLDSLPVTLDFSRCWIDSLGRRWGALGVGNADGFLCLDELDLEENLLPELPTASHLIPALPASMLPRVVEQPAASPASPLPWLLLSGAAAAFCVIWLLRQRKIVKSMEME